MRSWNGRRYYFRTLWFFFEVDHQPRGTSRHQQNFGFPAHIFVEVTYIFWKNTSKLCLLLLLKTVNGGRLFSFLNVKLLLKHQSPLNHYSEMNGFFPEAVVLPILKKWNHKVWRWMKLKTTSQLTKQYLQWSHCSNGFAAFTDWETCHFLDFVPTLTKVFFFMTTFSMCFLHSR